MTLYLIKSMVDIGLAHNGREFGRGRFEISDGDVMYWLSRGRNWSCRFCVRYRVNSVEKVWLGSDAAGVES